LKGQHKALKIYALYFYFVLQFIPHGGRAQIVFLFKPKAMSFQDVAIGLEYDGLSA
jgi:hypothetical protein